jgi:ABC-type uncharacterized transport system involved in gliding motility auxiliary subunit
MGIESTLQKWGVTLGDEMVMDTKNDTLPAPEQRDLGNGMVIQEVHQVPYPLFVKMLGDQVASSSPITSGLTGSVMHWASPVKAEAKVGDDTHKVDVLLRSSDASWLTSSTVASPDLRAYPGLGFPVPKDLPADKKGSQVMAVSIVGGFTSSAAKPDKNDKAAAATRLIEHSPPDTRMVVFGSSTFVSDLVQQLDSELTKSNIELVHNAVDWSLADTDLLGIRSRNAAMRALTVSPEARAKWIWANGLIALAGLVLVVVLAWLRRRAVQPIVTSGEA